MSQHALNARLCTIRQAVDISASDDCGIGCSDDRHSEGEAHVQLLRLLPARLRQTHLQIFLVNESEQRRGEENSEELHHQQVGSSERGVHAASEHRRSR